MAAGEKKKDWPYWCAATAIFLLVALVVWGGFRDVPEHSCACVLLGDSIYAEKRVSGCVTDRLSDLWNGSVFNGAMGGTSLARSDKLRHMDEKMDLLSLAALTKSITTKDFGVQKQIRVEIPATEYFPDVVGELCEIDFTKTELLLIGYGMNDYQNGVPADDPKDPMNEYTYGGALRSVLSALKKTYPEMRIILLTPTYSWYPDRQGSCEELDFGGGTLETYVLLEQEIGASYGVETIDLYHELYPHDSMEDWSRYTRDGVHPNEDGLELIARKIKSYLEDHLR